MALSNYTELKAAIARKVRRADMTDDIIDFITLAESEINADMRTRLMEVDETVTLTISTRTIALPARYIEPISFELVISGENNSQLFYKQPQQLAINAASGSRSRPQYWTINGDNIEFPNLSDATYTGKFRMLKGFDIASTNTNSLLTAYPGLYLYGALLHSAPHIKDDARMLTWQTMYQSLKKKVLRKEARSKVLTTLVTNLPSVRTRSNIYSG
jgi:hypothetical protein